MCYRDDYYSILAYMRMVLEPKMNLNSKELRKIKNSRISNLHYFIYSIFGLGTVVMCLMMGSSEMAVTKIAIVFFIVMVLLDIYYFFYSGKLYEKYERVYSQEN